MPTTTRMPEQARRKTTRLLPSRNRRARTKNTRSSIKDVKARVKNEVEPPEQTAQAGQPRAQGRQYPASFTKEKERASQKAAIAGGARRELGAGEGPAERMMDSSHRGSKEPTDPTGQAGHQGPRRTTTVPAMRSPAATVLLPDRPEVAQRRHVARHQGDDGPGQGVSNQWAGCWSAPPGAPARRSRVAPHKRGTGSRTRPRRPGTRCSSSCDSPASRSPTVSPGTLVRPKRTPPCPAGPPTAALRLSAAPETRTPRRRE